MKDSAIGAFITASDGYAIRFATEWANRTENPESRAARVTGMAQRWLGEDNVAARMWIQNTQLLAGMAERLSDGYAYLGGQSLLPPSYLRSLDCDLDKFAEERRFEPTA